MENSIEYIIDIETIERINKKLKSKEQGIIELILVEENIDGMYIWNLIEGRDITSFEKKITITREIKDNSITVWTDTNKNNSVVVEQNNTTTKESNNDNIKILNNLIFSFEYDCTNCTNCYNCKSCANCEDCRDCNGCDECKYCNDCYNCYKCNGCDECDECDNCRDCTNCEDCDNEIGCENYDTGEEREE